MEEIINKLKSQRESYQYCLDSKDWANDGSSYHKNIRIRYSNKVDNLSKAITTLNKLI